MACLCIGHRAFIFIFVGWKKARTNFVHLIFSDLLLTGAFLLKMQAATLNNLYHLYMVTFGGGSLKKLRTKSPLYCNLKFQSVILEHNLAAENAIYSRGVITTDDKTCSHKWGDLKTCSYYVLNDNGFALP